MKDLKFPQILNLGRSKLDSWLANEETQETLRQNLVDYADQMTTWIKNEDGQRVLADVIREIRIRGENFLRAYIREKVPELVNKVISSEKISEKLEKDILPSLGNKLAQFIDENRAAILGKLRLEQRVTETVHRMDVKHFHDSQLPENLTLAT